MRDDRHVAAYLLLATTGARRGEILGAMWSALDGNTLRIETTLLEVDGRVVVGTPKTRAGRRQIILDERTVEVLHAHRLRQVAERLQMGAGYNPLALIFVDSRGRPVRPNAFSKRFDFHVERLGLPSITLHGLRHTAASLAIAGGIDVVTVAQQLGHSQPSVTLNTYAHAMRASGSVAADLLGKAAMGRTLVSNLLAKGSANHICGALPLPIPDTN